MPGGIELVLASIETIPRVAPKSINAITDQISFCAYKNTHVFFLIILNSSI